MSDPELVEEVKQCLNISFNERDEVGPIICGTVVAGGFGRKLRMLRCDFFSMLSLCQSSHYVHDSKQSRKIRTGIIEMVKRTQSVSDADECIPYFVGWDGPAIVDKCLHNEAMEVNTVNMPDFSDPDQRETARLKKQRLVDKGDDYQAFTPCYNYVYAAYLPAGLH